MARNLLNGATQYNKVRRQTEIFRAQGRGFLRYLLFGVFLIGTAFSPVRGDQALASPEGPVLLVVKGVMSRPNAGAEAHFDLAMLQQLPAIDVSYTSFVSGKTSTFRGCRLQDLLDAIGSDATRLKATAADDYHSVIENIDLRRYPVIVAYAEDDRQLSLRTLGPLRIIFPFDDFPELVSKANRAAVVWQLTELELL